MLHRQLINCHYHVRDKGLDPRDVLEFCRFFSPLRTEQGALQKQHNFMATEG